MKAKFDVVNEQVILAVAMSDGKSLQQVLRYVDVKDFLGVRHRVIFKALEKCRSLDLETVNENIAVMAQGNKFGGLEYLEKIRKLKKTKTIGYNIDILRKDSARMNALKALPKIEERLGSKTFNFEECAEIFRSSWENLRHAPLTKDAENPADKFEKRFEKRRSGSYDFVGTGYKRSLDMVLTEGFARGSMTIIAGRSRMGKTMLLVDLIRRQLRKKKKNKLLVIPFEKGELYFMNMLVSAISGVELEDIIKYAHELPDKMVKRVLRANEKIRAYIDDGRLTIQENPAIKNGNITTNNDAMNVLETIIAEGEYDIACYDLVERMFRELEQSKIASAITRLHYLGEKYNLHQMFTHQLKRTAEERNQLVGSTAMNNRPTLIDLKNSGSYEEVSDAVLLIHREKVFKPMIARDVIEVNVAKQKLGKDLIVMLADFHPEVCRLENDRLITMSELIRPRFTWK